MTARLTSLMRAIRLLIAGISIAALTATAGLAATWDMATPYSDEIFHTVNIKQFAEDVKKATGGKFEINVHSGGSLFENPRIKDAVRSGEVPVGEFLLSELADENPVFEVDSIPFLATNYKAAEKLWAASRAPTVKLLEAQGLKVLFSVPWPPQGLYTEKEVTSVDDLKGLEFRAYNTATERLAELAGAMAIRVEIADIPQAFTTGRAQAMITSPSTGVNIKAWNFVDHFYNTRAWLPKNIVVVNTRAFQRLDAPIQAAVLKAATQAELRGWKMSRAETTRTIAVLAENGMKVSDPSPALEGGLEKVGKTMTAEWLEKAGAEGKAILAAYRKLFPLPL